MQEPEAARKQDFDGLREVRFKIPEESFHAGQTVPKLWEEKF
jgi:hypothetical protein